MRDGIVRTYMTPIQLLNNKVPANPIYNPLNTPLSFANCFAQSIGPEKSFGPTICIWSRALMCSIGVMKKQTVHPAIIPDAYSAVRQSARKSKGGENEKRGGRLTKCPGKLKPRAGSSPFPPPPPVLLLLVDPCTTP